jgi:hypothetical protein
VKKDTISSLKRDLSAAQKAQAQAAITECPTLPAHTESIFLIRQKIRELSASKDPRVLAGRQGTMVDGAS